MKSTESSEHQSLHSNSKGQRPRRKRRDRRTGLRLNMAPMIDMTFLLFSFVIVTSTFERPEGVLASQLPQQGGAPTVALPFSPIVVRLIQAGPQSNAYSITIDRVAEEIRTIEDLPPILRGMRTQPGFDENTPVVIVADDNVRWDYVVGCWNAAIRAGCENIAFAQQ